MKPSTTLPNDRATALFTLDQSLLVQLSEAVSNHFYYKCDRITQTLLSQCQWSIAANLDMPTLTVACPDAKTYWNVVSNIERISEYLSRVTRISRIEVIPRDKRNIYFEVTIGV